MVHVLITVEGWNNHTAFSFWKLQYTRLHVNQPTLRNQHYTRLSAFKLSQFYRYRFTVTVAVNKTSVGGASLSKLNATISHNTNQALCKCEKSNKCTAFGGDLQIFSSKWVYHGSCNEVYMWHIRWALKVNPPVLIIHWMWGCNYGGGKLSVHLGKPRSISTTTQITLHPCGPQQSTATEQAVI